MRGFRRTIRFLWTRGWTFDALAQRLRLNRALGAYVQPTLALFKRLLGRQRPLRRYHLAIDDCLRRPEPGGTARAKHAGSNRLH